MTFLRSIVLFGAATALLGQTPPPAPASQQAAPPVPQVQLHAENPPAPPVSVPPDTVVITVGDIKITAAQFDALIDSLQPQTRTAARGAGRKQFADNIVKMLTLAQEAEKRKLDQTSEFKAQALFQNYNLLANAMAGQVGKDVQVTDADLRQYYDAHKNEFDTVHARHILIRFKGSSVPVRPGQPDLSDAEALAKAQDIRKKLQDGGDFAALAKAESDDAGSGANGGELPAFRHGQMVPSFETAAFALKPGEISDPVKSQFGYHIILVVSHSSFEDVKADVEKRVQPEQSQKAINKFIDDLEKANPAVLDPMFFPAPPPSMPLTAPTPLKLPDKK
jgi:parvulin-like peptidyl-prolyl isomerase